MASIPSSVGFDKRNERKSCGILEGGAVMAEASVHDDVLLDSEERLQEKVPLHWCPRCFVGGKP